MGAESRLLELQVILGEKIGPSPNAYAIAWAVELVSNDSPEEQKLNDIYDFIGTSMMTHETVPAVLAYVVLADGDPLRAIRLSTWGGGRRAQYTVLHMTPLPYSIEPAAQQAA